MFSGIIQSIGKIEKVSKESITIKSENISKKLNVSESISVSGTCVTVVELGKEKSTFTVNVIPETFRRTNLSFLLPNSRVNLEIPTMLGEKIGGHLVQGHIDCTSKINSIIKEENSFIVSISKPKNISKYMIEKGFIAVDGVSLTIVEINNENFTVSLIPYTWENTIFKYSEESKLVNIETDLTAKYIENFYNHSK